MRGNDLFLRLLLVIVPLALGLTAMIASRSREASARTQEPGSADCRCGYESSQVGKFTLVGCRPCPGP